MILLPKIHERFRGARTVNCKIFVAALIVGGLSCVVKISAMGKELLVASFFGRGDDIEAFLIGFLLPSMFVSLVGTTLMSALVPTFIEVQEKDGREAVNKVLSSAMLVTLAMLLGVTLVLATVGPFALSILASGFSAEKLALTRHLYFALLPYVIVNGLVLVWGAILNAGERFVLPALTPVLTPISIALVLLSCKSLGVGSLVIGTYVGAVLEAVLLAVALSKSGMSFNCRWFGMSSYIRQILRQYPPLLLAATVSSGNIIVDQAMAAMLVGGSVAALSYGMKMTSMLGTLAATSLSTAIIPYLSRMTAQEDWAGCRRSLKVFTRIVLIVFIPVALGIAALSTPIVHLLFQRGAFTSADTAIVAKVQAMSCLQVPFMAAGLMYTRLLSAMKRNNIVMWIGCLNLLLDVIYNIVFIRLMGVAGIALSTSVFCLTSYALKAYIVHRMLRARMAPDPFGVPIPTGFAD